MLNGLATAIFIFRLDFPLVVADADVSFDVVCVCVLPLKIYFVSSFIKLLFFHSLTRHIRSASQQLLLLLQSSFFFHLSSIISHSILPKNWAFIACVLILWLLIVWKFSFTFQFVHMARCNGSQLNVLMMNEMDKTLNEVNEFTWPANQTAPVRHIHENILIFELFDTFDRFLWMEGDARQTSQGIGNADTHTNTHKTGQDKLYPF